MSKGGGWVTIKLSDIIERPEDKVYSFEPHKPQPLKGLPWPYCVHCGLLYLRNDVTKLCIKLGCKNSLHPSIRNYWKCQKK